MAELKSDEEIKVLKQGGRILAGIVNRLVKAAKPGKTTRELDDLVGCLIEEAGGEPSFLGYGGTRPFPAALCASVNEQLVHGIPGEYILKSGDILSLDLGLKYPRQSGLYTDMAVTIAIGKISSQAKELIKVTENALAIWIKNIKSGADLNIIAKKVQEFVEKEGFSVVRDLVGHGVGHAVHEAPNIPNFFVQNWSYPLKEGMVLAFEPMVSAGDYRIKVLEDGWTVVTRDSSLCAHFEHTVAVTKQGCLILTK